jgi:hypothetical protein
VVGGQRHAPAVLPLGRRPCTYCIGGWVGPIVGLEGLENLPHTGIRSPDRPALASRVTHGINSVKVKPLGTLRPIYIGQAHRYPPNTPFYHVYFFSTIIRTEFFLNMLHTLRFFFLFKM